MEGNKRIGILTGGGDCPGLNAAIRAVTKAALRIGYEVIGFNDGWEGVNGATLAGAEWTNSQSDNGGNKDSPPK